MLAALHQIAQSVMHHPVCKGRSGNESGSRSERKGHAILDLSETEPTQRTPTAAEVRKVSVLVTSRVANSNRVEFTGSGLRS